MAAKTLQDLFNDQLTDAYSAETQLVKALPKMAKAANAAQLREAFEKHLAETQTQVKRLEKVGRQLGVTFDDGECEAMEGLITEGKEVMDAGYDPDVLDAGLIAAAQKVEHYEIATYGTICALAKQLGHEDIGKTLHLTLEEEKKADEKLTKLAEHGINLAEHGINLKAARM